MKGLLYPVTTVTLLTLLFTSFFTVETYAHTFPICQTYNVSGGRSYEICLDNVTYNGSQSTWTYTYRTLSGNDLSHLTFGIPCGTKASDYAATSGCSAISYGSDPTTGANGIKFDCGVGSGGRTVTFTIKGAYSIGLIQYGIKTGGSGQQSFLVEGVGPSCATIPALPNGTACENAVEYLSTYGLITTEDLNTLSDVHYNVFVGRDLIRYPGGGDFLGQDGIFSSATQRGLEVAGEVKSGSNLKYSGALAPPPTNTFTKTNSTQYQVNGYNFSLNTSGAALFYDLTLPAKAAQIKSDLEEASQTLASAAPNNVATGNLTFNVNNVNANGIAVFNIAASNIAANANVQINNNANAKTIIINVSGTTVNWTNGVNVNINQNLWSKILWNFPQATNVSVNSLKGIVLAPKAVFTSNSANEGSVAVKTYNGDGEIHRPYFSGDFSTICEEPAPEITLNLTAECKAGNTLYWRVTGDDDVDNVAFSWNGPGSNDGTGTVNAGDVFYFTTQDAGGSNTTSISWFDPSSGQTKTTTKAHSNKNCVYHIEFAKKWQGAAAPQLYNQVILTAESSIATATCGYNGSGIWYCTYTSKSGGTLGDLEVPFGETYSVQENTVNGWVATEGIGSAYTYVEGFDNTALPNALVYQLSDDAFAQPISGKAAKYGKHTVTNSFLPPGVVSPLCVTTGDTYAIDFDIDENGNTLAAGTGIGNSGSLIQPYANLFGAGEGMSFVSSNELNRPLTLYNSEGTNGLDPDLERNEDNDGNWATGNLTNEILGNLLIVNATNNPSIPNDNANGGEILSISTLPLQSFSFDIVDLENVGADDRIIFENTTTGESASILFSAFLASSGSPFAVPGVAYGDRSANRITGITADKLGISSFNRITFDTDDSFGIGAICVEKAVLTRTISIKVFLQGGFTPPELCPPLILPTDPSLMTNFLQQQSLLPTVNPYGLPQTYNNINNQNGVVGLVTDWVLVELRDGANPNIVLEQKAGLLKVNGWVVDENDEPLTFTNTTNPIYLVVKHRNHLTISSPLITLNDGDTYDFTTAIDKAYGFGNQMAEVNGKYVMWGGDVNGDGMVYYEFPGNDRDELLGIIGGDVFGYLFGYYDADVNLDGMVFYDFDHNDREWILGFVLSGDIFGFLMEELPFTNVGSLSLTQKRSNFELFKTQITKQEVKLYPNPNYTTQATIEVNAAQDETNAAIQIYDLQGKVLRVQDLSLAKGFNRIIMNTDNLADGVYSVRIVGTREAFAPIQLIKTR